MARRTEPEPQGEGRVTGIFSKLPRDSVAQFASQPDPSASTSVTAPSGGFLGTLDVVERNLKNWDVKETCAAAGTGPGLSLLPQHHGLLIEYRILYNVLLLF